jgi:hypothetical protein
MKTYGGVEMAPLFLTSALDGGVVSFTPALPPGKSPPVPTGPQSRSGRCEEEKTLALPGIEPGPSSP